MLVDTFMNTLVKKASGKQFFHRWARDFSKMPKLQYACDLVMSYRDLVKN